MNVNALLRSAILLAATMALAQAVPLETYASPDGSFEFTYPSHFRIYDGKNIAQARGIADVASCQPDKSLVCLVYPEEESEGDALGGAVFSVNAVPQAATEDACLRFTDLGNALRDLRRTPRSETLGNAQFNVIEISGTAGGHTYLDELFRAYHGSRCVELQIRSTVDNAGAQGGNRADASRAHTVLRRIARSFRFQH